LLKAGLPTSALAIESINALFAPLANARGVLLAVSGGPDSTALLLMAAQWMRQSSRPRVDVATVDHAMRPGAREEGEAVAALCARLGFVHHLLEWRGEKPRSRIQERAREARYSLLIDCARAIDADYLVTAHHADDQAETVLFRLLRGSGIAGLAGMPALATRDGIHLARPLLGLSKADLLTYCEDHGEAFARDPSNDDPRFARTRLRKMAALLAAEGLGAAELARLARRAASMEEAVRRQADAANVRLDWSGSGQCDARLLFDEPLEIVQRLLAARIAEVRGAEERPPKLEQLEWLASALRNALESKAALRANIGGVSIELDARGKIAVSPERPRRSAVAEANVQIVDQTRK
jgi:tRNA(Ile)-lysidine synthase